MSELYGPFASGAGAGFTATYWQEFFGQMFTAGVWKDAKVNGTSSGNCAVSVGTGMQVSIATGVAFAYGFFYENTAALTQAIAASDPSLNRIDYVVIELDTAAATIVSKVLTGTAASSPVAPTLTQTSTTWDIPLAQVYVGAGVSSLTSGNITDSRDYSHLKTLPSTSNMGPGSGLDADTVDTIQGSSLVQTAGQVTRILAVTTQPTDATGNNGDMIIWY